MTTGLTFGQRQRTSIPIDQRVLARQLMSGVQTANQMNPAANIQPLAQPMAQPMAQGQGPSFRFQDLNRAFQLDPRNTLSNTLLERGMRGGPVRTPLEGIGRLSQSLVGAMLQKRALDRLEGQETTRQENLQTQYDAILGNLPQNVRSLLPTIATPEALQSVQQLGLQVASAPTSEFSFQEVDGNIVYGTNVTNPLTNTTTFTPAGQFAKPKEVKPPAKTAAIQIADDLGLTGDDRAEFFDNYKKNTVINLDQTTETEKSKVGTKLGLETLQKLQQELQADQQITFKLNTMAALLENNAIETGPITNATKPIRAVLNSLGLLSSEDSQQLTNQEIFEAAAKYIIPRMRPPGSGATSNFEINTFESAAASLNKTEESNLIIVKGMLALQEHKKQSLMLMDKYLQSSNQGLLGFAEYEEQNRTPIFKMYQNEEEYNTAKESGILNKGDLFYDGVAGEFKIEGFGE
tara:strand:+ start:61 stop:1449 length:1389 start_codon:yes stop_codon:yes gene_type:complete